MKFQFLGRMPSLTASVVSDISSSYGETETSTHSSIDRQRSSVVYDEMETTMAMFEWDQSMDSSHLGIAASTVSTFCSMVQSELAGCAYDPSRNHTYKSDESEPRTNTVDEKCRSKMLEWCFKMVDFFHIDRSVVPIAASYQDRFLSSSMGESARTHRETFRIASVTCLYIAIKLYVPHKWNVTAHAFAQLCRGTISGESIVDMEMQILFGLGWNMHPPVPMSYLELILELISIATSIDERPMPSAVSDEDSVLGDLILPSLSNVSSDSATQECAITELKENMIDLVRYQVELTLQKIDFLHTRSSLIVLAALLNAIEGIISQNDAQGTQFCRHAVAVVAKLMSYSELCSKREIDEVRAMLLCSVMAEPGSCVLLQGEGEQDQNITNTLPKSIIATASSPISTSNWNDQGHYLSPKSVLSRVCAIHCRQCNNSA